MILMRYELEIENGKEKIERNGDKDLGKVLEEINRLLR